MQPSHELVHYSTQFLCRVCRGRCLPNVVHLIDRYLDDYRDQRVFTRECERGAPISTLEAILAWTAPCWKEAVDAAARGGHIHVLKWMMMQRKDKRGPWKVDFIDALRVAAENNSHVDMLAWMHSCDYFKGCSAGNAMKRAAENGNLEVLKWLMKNRPESRSDKAVVSAARSGHLPVVQWLHSNLGGSERILSMAIRDAAGSGHLDVVEWLLNNGVSVFDVAVMDKAAQGNHFHVVCWLFGHGCTCSPLAVTYAASNGNLEMMRWFHEHFDDQFTPSVMDTAAGNGHLDLVQWLHERRNEGCTTKAMDLAAAGGHIEVVQWLHCNRLEGCTGDAMVSAAEHGHLELVQWLHECRPELNYCEATARECREGRLDVVRYLDEHRWRWEFFAGTRLTNAILNGHLDVARYVYDSNACRDERYLRRKLDQSW